MQQIGINNCIIRDYMRLYEITRNYKTYKIL